MSVGGDDGVAVIRTQFAVSSGSVVIVRRSRRELERGQLALGDGVGPGVQQSARPRSRLWLITNRPSLTPSTAKRPSSVRSTVSVGLPAAARAALNSANVVPGAGGRGLILASSGGRLRCASHSPVSSSPPEG